jgi:hypothetical protein
MLAQESHSRNPNLSTNARVFVRGRYWLGAQISLDLSPVEAANLVVKKELQELTVLIENVLYRAYAEATGGRERRTVTPGANRIRSRLDSRDWVGSARRTQTRKSSVPPVRAHVLSEQCNSLSRETRSLSRLMYRSTERWVSVPFVIASASKSSRRYVGDGTQTGSGLHKRGSYCMAVFERKADNIDVALTLVKTAILF